jgi:ABC-type lipoprotein export system ATPase subunit
MSSALVARMIVTVPAPIMANEPTGNRGSAPAQELQTTLSCLNPDKKVGKAIMMVAHDQSAAPNPFPAKSHLRAEHLVGAVLSRPFASFPV